MINPQSEVQPEQASRHPLGLLYIAAFLAGHAPNSLDIGILDLQTHSLQHDTAKTISDFNPDIVMTTAITPYAPYAQKIGQMVREIKPQALSLIGGYHATVRPEETLRPGQFDIAVHGEGEETMFELISALAASGLSGTEQLLKIPGLFFQTENQLFFSGPRTPQIPLTKYPWASLGIKHLINDGTSYRVFGDTKKNDGPPGTMITSRGCTYNCANCGSKKMFPNVRNRPPIDVVNEIVFLNNEYCVKNFYFADDTINQNPDRLKEICQLLIERRLPIEWVAMARIDHLDKELFQLAAQAGAVEFAFGVESADPKVLAALDQEKTNLENAVTVRTMLANVEIETKFYLMTGNPKETPSSSHITAEFLRATQPDKIRISRSIPYPGAPFGAEIEVVPPYDKQYEHWWAFPPPSNPFGAIPLLTQTPLMTPQEIEDARQLLISTHLEYGGKI